MAYEPYADADYYINVFQGATIPDSKIETRLKEASRSVDTLTFNRIIKKGFESLSAFQREIIREIVCEQAEFLHSNEDLLENMLSSYSINGVSVGFGESWNVRIEKGVAMKRQTYEMLSQTGLTNRVLR